MYSTDTIHPQHRSCPCTARIPSMHGTDTIHAQPGSRPTQHRSVPAHPAGTPCQPSSDPAPQTRIPSPPRRGAPSHSHPTLHPQSTPHPAPAPARRQGSSPTLPWLPACLLGPAAFSCLRCQPRSRSPPAPPAPARPGLPCCGASPPGGTGHGDGGTAKPSLRHSHHHPAAGALEAGGSAGFPEAGNDSCTLWFHLWRDGAGGPGHPTPPRPSPAAWLRGKGSGCQPSSSPPRRHAQSRQPPPPRSVPPTRGTHLSNSARSSFSRSRTATCSLPHSFSTSSGWYPGGTFSCPDCTAPCIPPRVHQTTSPGTPRQPQWGGAAPAIGAMSQLLRAGGKASWEP